MFPLTGQTAGPNELYFLWTLMGSLGVTKAVENSIFYKFFFVFFFCLFHRQRRAFQLVLYKYIYEYGSNRICSKMKNLALS